MVFLMLFIIILSCGIYLEHCIVNASQESCLGTVEIVSMLRTFIYIIKDVKQYHSERMNKMSL